MNPELIHAKDGDFAIPLTGCGAQGVAMCHRNKECSNCPFALAKLNPDVPLYFLMSGRRNKK